MYWNPNNFENYFEDKILGNYKYLENGNVITNTLTWNTSNDLYSTTFPAIMSNCFKPLFKELLINMRDIGKKQDLQSQF